MGVRERGSGDIWRRAEGLPWPPPHSGLEGNAMLEKAAPPLPRLLTSHHFTPFSGQLAPCEAGGNSVLPGENHSGSWGCS